jgi:hypothetical protein
VTNIQSSGIEPGQRRLNGPQTTGRKYRNLSQPAHAMAQDDDVAVPMRDGVTLLADVHRPVEPGLLEFRHATVGTSSLNTVFSSSRLLLPVFG